MKDIAPAKTPTVAIARELRSLGLKQGQDFRVRGQYQGTGANRERIGTYVAVLSGHGDQVIADNADHIERRVLRDSGFRFNVSIHFTAGGRLWTWVANYGQRTRDTAPVATADQGSGVLDSTSRQQVKQIEQRPGCTAAPVIKATLGKPRPAFEQPDAHPYDGLAQKRFGSMYWACAEAGRVWFFQDGRNTARYTLTRGAGHYASDWYLTGPGVHPTGVSMGASLTEAADKASDTILEHKRIAEGMARAGRDWPKGTRVQGLDSAGVLRTGTVNGVDVGMVVEPGHDNYGRTFVGVNWDAPERPESGYISRNHPFTDSLTRI